MNEQFETIFNKINLPYTEGDTAYTVTGSDLQKFAELIVLEMCSVLDRAQWDKGQDWVCADGTRIIPQIKQHFGVKE